MTEERKPCAFCGQPLPLHYRGRADLSGEERWRKRKEDAKISQLQLGTKAKPTYPFKICPSCRNMMTEKYRHTQTPIERLVHVPYPLGSNYNVRRK